MSLRKISVLCVLSLYELFYSFAFGLCDLDGHGFALPVQVGRVLVKYLERPLQLRRLVRAMRPPN